MDSRRICGPALYGIPERLFTESAQDIDNCAQAHFCLGEHMAGRALAVPRGLHFRLSRAQLDRVSVDRLGFLLKGGVIRARIVSVRTRAVCANLCARVQRAARRHGRGDHLDDSLVAFTAFVAGHQPKGNLNGCFEVRMDLEPRGRS